MISLRWFLMVAGVAMFGSTASVVAYDVYLATQFQRLLGSEERGVAEKARTHRPSRPVLTLAQGMKSK